MGMYKYFFSEPKENEILETIFFFLCYLFTMRIICAILKKKIECAFKIIFTQLSS